MRADLQDPAPEEGAVVMDKHFERSDGYTRHVRSRMRQRAICPAAVDWVLRFGDCRPARRGAESYFFTKRSWRRLESYLGSISPDVDKYRNLYVILADGAVVTAAYRH